jgi:hypothetical protein
MMSSIRTEMCGLFAAVTHLRLVVEYFHIVPSEKASCRTYCDSSRAALARVVDKYYEDFGTTWRCRQHYDFEVAIRTSLLQLPISIEWKWARGHASSRKKDRTSPFLKYLTKPLTILQHYSSSISNSHAAGQRTLARTNGQHHWSTWPYVRPPGERIEVLLYGRRSALLLVQQVSLVVLSSCLTRSYWNIEGLVQKVSQAANSITRSGELLTVNTECN